MSDRNRQVAEVSIFTTEVSSRQSADRLGRSPHWNLAGLRNGNHPLHALREPVALNPQSPLQEECLAAARLLTDARSPEARTALSWLCNATRALAAGFWLRDGEFLTLASFSAHVEMPDDVQQAFQAATARVSLDQTALAIVQAVHARHTVTAVPPPEGQAGQGSPEWLRRFAARQSAAVPVQVRGEVRAALAVATTYLFLPNEIETIETVARKLGALLEAV